MNKYFFLVLLILFCPSAGYAGARKSERPGTTIPALAGVGRNIKIAVLCGGI